MDETTVKTPKKKMIKVKIVRQGLATSVAEYSSKGHTVRVMIPTTDVVNGTVDEVTLGFGLPYGVPWETIELPTFTAQDLADELHKYDIWTSEDAQKNINVVQGAVSNITGRVVQRILRLANQYQSKD